MKENVKFMDNNRNNILYGWVFHKDLDGNWCTAKREYYYELFSGEKGNVFKSKDISTLEELIAKTNGDKAEIEKLLNEKKTIDKHTSKSNHDITFKSEN